MLVSGMPFSNSCELKKRLACLIVNQIAAAASRINWIYNDKTLFRYMNLVINHFTRNVAIHSNLLNDFGICYLRNIY